MRVFWKSSCRHSSCERGLLLSIFDFKRKKYRTFLQDSETGEEIAEEYEKGRGVWKKQDVQDGKGSEMREDLIRKHYWFSGRVQGVGFRYRGISEGEREKRWVCDQGVIVVWRQSDS